MNSPSASLALAAHLALLSSISFGGFPTVLPDIHTLIKVNGWVTDREFEQGGSPWLLPRHDGTPVGVVLLLKSFHEAGEEIAGHGKGRDQSSDLLSESSAPCPAATEAAC
jgi:hypothetical protein